MQVYGFQISFYSSSLELNLFVFHLRNGLFLDSPEEFRILCCFVQDILQIWNRISLGCRQSLTATIKDILTKLPSVCKEAQLEDAAMQHIILSLLQAFGKEIYSGMMLRLFIDKLPFQISSEITL